MADQRTDAAEPAQVAIAADSHGSATSPSAKPALLDGANQNAGHGQNGLDVRAAVPLHVRPVLNGYAEVQACGICSERSLRRHIATGRVRKSVIRTGRRLRFVVQDLLDELRQAED